MGKEGINILKTCFNNFKPFMNEIIPYGALTLVEQGGGGFNV